MTSNTVKPRRLAPPPPFSQTLAMHKLTGTDILHTVRECVLWTQILSIFIYTENVDPMLTLLQYYKITAHVAKEYARTHTHIFTEAKPIHCLANIIIVSAVFVDMQRTAAEYQRRFN